MSLQEGYAVDYGVVMTYGARHEVGLPLLTPTLPQIRRLQDLVASVPQVSLDPEHDFAPGMYVRSLKIPAGTVVVGKMHRHAHPTLLVKGEATILTNNGMERIRAPYRWISQPGAKRPVLAHTDCEFVTVHLNPDDTTDLEVLEDQIIVPEALIDYTEEGAPEQIGQFTDELQAAYA
jgi:hypothetical protein